jgi:uncharacterized protein (TIGR02246 family)
LGCATVVAPMNVFSLISTIGDFTASCTPCSPQAEVDVCTRDETRSKDQNAGPRTGLAAQTPTRAADSCDLSTAAKAKDEAGIKETMAAYNAALNAGETTAVLPLYTVDGVFMPPYSQSAEGMEAVKKAYDSVFDELKFHVRFTIAELVVMSPTWAYVRTNSAGTTDHHSTGKTTTEANQELFIFEKGNDGKWRVARYSFSPTSPPRP